jgi:CubicO group peptidase (beta-lactamase class C family)
MRQSLARFLLIACVTPATGRAQAATQRDSLPPTIGLWGVTYTGKTFIGGELTLQERGNDWTAAIGGMSTPAHVAKDSISFVLAGGNGSFRGRTVGGGERAQRIRGLWTQPAGAITGVAYATPVELTRISENAWRGTVSPLEDATTVYLDIRREKNDTTYAVLRNPDGFYRNGRLRMETQGTHFQLKSVDNGRTLLEGDYDAKADRILLPVPDLGATLTLARVSRVEAVSYYPRTPAGEHYIYHQPLVDGDGWRTATLRAVGLDSAPITALVRKIIDTDPRPQYSPLIQSLLIARHGKLAVEEYFYGQDEERPHDLRSAGKTFASVLVGIAIDRGAKLSPATPVYALFPEYATLANPDARKQRMTLEHLMTMTSGFDCDENGNDDATGNEDKMQMQTAQPDWYRFMLDVRLVAAPGDSFAYCSGAVNLIGGMIANATHEWLPEHFDRNLAQPLQMRRYHMNLTPTGNLYLGGGLHIRPRDELKLGQTYLDGGLWNGRRIISKRWVDLSTSPHPMNAGGRDGYDWHLYDIKAGGRTYREYEASGNGGQMLMVLPELDMVVMFTASNYGNYNVWRRFRDELLPQFIIAAAKAPRG